MSELKQINALSERIEKMQKEAAKSTKIYAIMYLVLVLFVFIWTNYVLHEIKDKVTPDNLSAQLRVFIEEDLLSDANSDKVISYCKKNAPVWADDLVGMTHEQLIPMLKHKVKDVIDSTADEGIATMKKEHLPAIKKILKENASYLTKSKDVTDPNIAKELAKIMANECEKEIDGFVNDNVKYRINILRKQLDKMATTSPDKLSKREAAERKVIVNWVYLLEHEESPADSLGELLKSINGAYEDFIQDFSIPKKK